MFEIELLLKMTFLNFKVLATFHRLGEHITFWCGIFLGWCISKLIKIGSFLTVLLKKNNSMEVFRTMVDKFKASIKY